MIKKYKFYNKIQNTLALFFKKDRHPMAKGKYNKEKAPQKHSMNNQILEDILKKINLLKGNRIDDDESVYEDVKYSLNIAFIYIAVYIARVKKELKNEKN